MWFQIEKPVGTHPSEKSENKDKTNRRTSKTQQSGSGWFGGIWDKLARRPNNQMKLPDDKNPSPPHSHCSLNGTDRHALLYLLEPISAALDDYDDSSECSDVPEPCEMVGGIMNVVRSDHSGSDDEPDNDLHQVTAQHTIPHQRRPAVRVPPPWSRTAPRISTERDRQSELIEVRSTVSAWKQCERERDNQEQMFSSFIVLITHSTGRILLKDADSVKMLPQIVWDEKSKRWVNTDASEEEQSAQLKPPPKASELNGSAIPSAPTQAPTSTPASGPGMATSGLPPPSTTSTNIYKLQRGKDNQGGGFSWEIEWINQNDLLVVGSVMPDACLLQVAETASQSRDDVICVMGGTTVTIWEPTSNLLIFGRRISSLKQENACTVNNIPNEV
ncbi:hypothetical protein J6590_099730 [Homalodisca vitripennis]|nr:hypothetical protein J6590_099730 [Homalodisca vitripennis]